MLIVKLSDSIDYIHNDRLKCLQCSRLVCRENLPETLGLEELADTDSLSILDVYHAGVRRADQSSYT